MLEFAFLKEASLGINMDMSTSFFGESDTLYNFEMSCLLLTGAEVTPRGFSAVSSREKEGEATCTRDFVRAALCFSFCSLWGSFKSSNRFSTRRFAPSMRDAIARDAL